MKSKAKYTKVTALIALLAILCLMLSSCMTTGVLSGVSGGYLTEEQINQLIDERLSSMTAEQIEEIVSDKLASGGLSVGDTNVINITLPNGGSVAVGGKALLSAVKIVCKFEYKSGGWYPTVQEGTSNGSGVIYRLDKESGDAYIITNYHVVHYEKATTENGISDDIKLYLYGMDAEEYAIPATYVGGSQNYDIAVLKVENSSVLRGSNAAAATFADSDEVSVLDMAIAVGNAEALGISATVGYVNVDSEYITMSNDDGTTSQLRVMRIDTAVNSGNSGGGLFNDRGEVIGIVNAKLLSASSSSVENISYAIPSNVAKNVADNIIYYCDSESKLEGCQSVYRCIIGYAVAAVEYYTEYDTETGKVHKCEKVAISEIQSGGLASEKLKVGDIIKSVTVEGVTYEVTRLYHAIDCMLNVRVGHTVTFSIIRGGEEMTVEISVTENSLKKY